MVIVPAGGNQDGGGGINAGETPDGQVALGGPRTDGPQYIARGAKEIGQK